MFLGTVKGFLRGVVLLGHDLEPDEHITLYEACRGILDHLKTHSAEAAVDEMSEVCDKYELILSTLSTLPSVGDEGPLYYLNRYVSPFGYIPFTLIGFLQGS
jgi:hypothetical protein